MGEITCMNFSLVIPVYNRPDEVRELLESLVLQNFANPFEVVIVEDGSAVDCREVVAAFQDRLQISYYFKENSGPGDSRNFGMSQAKGDYFIIFDSDCIIPPDYLTKVDAALKERFADFFGGPDAATDSFTDVQKAINFAMTSVLTTGGVRGGSEGAGKFQPRSFNMGLSRRAFDMSGGFGHIHPGEDPELSMRLWRMGIQSRLIPQAFVFHKRRIDWQKFSLQVSKFGKARPILDEWFPEYRSLTYWFPALFIMGLAGSIVLAFLGFGFFISLYVLYFLAIFISSSLNNHSISIGWLSVCAVLIQFYGYGTGYLQSFFAVRMLGRKPEVAFPELFFRKKP